MGREWEAAAAGVPTAAVVPGICRRWCALSLTSASAWALVSAQLNPSRLGIMETICTHSSAQQQPCEVVLRFSAAGAAMSACLPACCLATIHEGQRAEWKLSALGAMLYKLP